jgi:hypothetical protein
MKQTAAGITAATVASSTALRLRCLAQRIHDLGPNPLFQMMCELSGSSVAMNCFERYGGALAAHGDLVAALGGLDLPPPRLWVVK